MIRPESPEQLAEALRSLASEHRTIRLGGNFSKDRLGVPVSRKAAPVSGIAAPVSASAGATVCTSSMRRLLQYEPADLTVSVEAGMPFAELERTLAERKQMLPLDPAWAEESTVGGVVAANLSGPRRRLYGTARDMIIGMTFVTLEGKLIQSGGMVVKNVAGLDMAKLMVGSFGTLAAIAVVNFKVCPMPVESRTFVIEFATAREAFAERDRILASVLQPSAIDIVNWPSGFRSPSGFRFPPGFRLMLRAGGNAHVLDRYARELPGARVLSGEEEATLWQEVREFMPRFLAGNAQGGVVSVSTSLTSMCGAIEALEVPVIARAGSGVFYAHYATNPPHIGLGGDAAVMARIKDMFDPEHLLNPGRLYGFI